MGGLVDELGRLTRSTLGASGASYPSSRSAVVKRGQGLLRTETTLLMIIVVHKPEPWKSHGWLNSTVLVVCESSSDSGRRTADSLDGRRDTLEIKSQQGKKLFLIKCAVKTLSSNSESELKKIFDYSAHSM